MIIKTVGFTTSHDDSKEASASVRGVCLHKGFPKRYMQDARSCFAENCANARDSLSRCPLGEASASVQGVCIEVFPRRAVAVESYV